jgi:hypothetical protein
VKNVKKVLIPYRPMLSLLDIKIGTAAIFLIVDIPQYFIDTIYIESVLNFTDFPPMDHYLSP